MAAAGITNLGKRQLEELKDVDKALDLSIKLVKKLVGAAQQIAKDLEKLGIPKEEAGQKALEMIDNGFDRGHRG